MGGDSFAQPGRSTYRIRDDHSVYMLHFCRYFYISIQHIRHIGNKKVRPRRLEKMAVGVVGFEECAAGKAAQNPSSLAAWDLITLSAATTGCKLSLLSLP